MKVYVYKQYYDDYAYFEEKIRVFANKKNALAALKKDVEEAYELSWDEIPKEVPLDDLDTFSEDCVSIYEDGATSFWAIDEREIEDFKEDKV